MGNDFGQNIAQQAFWANLLGMDILGHGIKDQQNQVVLLLSCAVYAMSAPYPPPVAPKIRKSDDEKKIVDSYHDSLYQWAVSCKNAGDALLKVAKDSISDEDELPYDEN